MGTITITEFVSLDGVMEAPGGEPGYAHSGWVMDFNDPRQLAFKLEELLAAEALLIGRVTYEGFAGAWPQRRDEAGFADKMNRMPKHVVSSTLQDPAWENTTVLRGDVAEQVRALKREVAGEILVAGSRTLVHELLRHDDLVDELRLLVFPVVLGSGFRLYPESPDKLALDLVEQQRFDSGTLALRYEPRGTAAA